MYRPGDHFIACHVYDNDYRYVWRDHWTESPIRPDWYEVMSFDGVWNVNYPNGAAIFSSRAVRRGYGSVSQAPTRYQRRLINARWGEMLHTERLWKPRR